MPVRHNATSGMLHVVGWSVLAGPYLWYRLDSYLSTSSLMTHAATLNK